MTTLGSWIDDEALARVIRQLCPDPAPPPLPSWPPGHRKAGDPGATAAEDTRVAPSGPRRVETPQGNRATSDDADESVPLESLPPTTPGLRKPPALVQRLEALKERAERSGLIGNGTNASPGPATPARHSPEFVPPEESLTARLSALENWMRQCAGARHVCLADHRGEALTNGAAPEELAAAASLLADAMHRSLTEAGFALGGMLHAQTSPAGWLSVIAVDTPDGLFSIAIQAEAPLATTDACRFADAFRAAVGAARAGSPATPVSTSTPQAFP